MRLSLDAPAKINLDLRVLAREASGYHVIETLLLLIDLFDQVTVEEGGSGVRLEVSGAELGPVEENLAHRAASRFLKATGIDAGVRIELEKGIPAGAGLGGGSSDAAAVLRLLNQLFDAPLETGRLRMLAAELGADVPFFLGSTGYALGWGRGGRLLELPPPDPRPLVLALPSLHVSTAQAYAAFAARDLEPGRPRALRPEELSDWGWIARHGRNDFEPVLFERYPELAHLRELAASEGARPARMSGSGSAIFGVLASEPEAHEVARRLEEATGEGRVQVVRTRSEPTRSEPVEG